VEFALRHTETGHDFREYLLHTVQDMA